MVYSLIKSYGTLWVASVLILLAKLAHARDVLTAEAVPQHSGRLGVKYGYSTVRKMVHTCLLQISTSSVHYPVALGRALKIWAKCKLLPTAQTPTRHYQNTKLKKSKKKALQLFWLPCLSTTSTSTCQMLAVKESDDKLEPERSMPWATEPAEGGGDMR